MTRKPFAVFHSDFAHSGSTTAIRCHRLDDFYSILLPVFARPFVKTVRPTQSDRCLPCLSCLTACDVGVLWPNGWMDQDETSHGGRPRPGHIELDGDPAPQPQRGTAHLTIFGPCLLRPKGWIGQDVTSYGGRLRPTRHCVRCGPNSSR